MRPPKKNLHCPFAALLVLTAAFACTARAQEAGGWEWVDTRGRGMQLGDARLRAVYSRYDERRFGSDKEHVWIGGAKGFVAHTEDGGKSWKGELLDTKAQVNDIYFREDKGFLLAGNGVYRSNGNEWLRDKPFSLKGGAMPELYSVNFGSQRGGCVVGVYGLKGGVADGLIFCSKDGGESWQTRRVPVKRQLYSVYFVDERNGWIAGGGGLILSTNDGGDTWHQQKSGTTASLFSVRFTGELTGWAVGERCTILYTNSGGEQWAPVRSAPCADARYPLLRSIQFWDRRGWIVGSGGTIFYTNDGGDQWKMQNSGWHTDLLALSLGGSDKKHGWAVGNGGTILKYRLK